MLDYVLPYPFSDRPGRDLGEFFLLALACLAVIIFPDPPLDISSLTSGVSGSTWDWYYRMLLFRNAALGAAFVPLVLGIFLLARFCRTRESFLLWTAAGFVASFCLLQYEMWPDMVESNRFADEILDKFRLPVTSLFPGWRAALEWLVAMLAAVLAARPGSGGTLRLGRYLGAFLVALMVMRLLFHGGMDFFPPPDGFTSMTWSYDSGFRMEPDFLTFGMPTWIYGVARIAGMTLIALLAFVLPGQRAVLERLASSGASMPTGGRRTVRGIAGAALLLASVAFFAVVSHYEWKMIRVLRNGPDPGETRVRSGRDARELFDRLSERVGHRELQVRAVSGATYWTVVTRTKYRIDFPAPVSTYDFCSPSTPDTLRRAVHELLDPEFTEWLYEEIGAWIATLEAASDYDFMSSPSGSGDPDFPVGYITARDLSRTIGMRAVIRMHSGDPEGALHDIGLILRFGALLDTGDRFLPAMIGSAVRSIGLSAAFNYYLIFRNDPARLAELEALLVELEPRMRLRFDPERFIPSEPCLWRILPYAEFNESAMDPALRPYHAAWVKYDQLRLALMLERRRDRTGSYPDKLSELMEDGLEDMPIDPCSNEPYRYVNLGEEFEIVSAALRLNELQNYSGWHHWNLPFPHSAVMDDENLVEALAALDEIAAEADPGE